MIGSYIGHKVLLATPLLKWYLEHGLVVTHVYETVEYTPEACFRQFGESVSAAHHLGDENPEHAIIASTQKLIGNSSYGKCITNKDTHHNICYCDDQEAPMKVNEPQFHQLNPLSNDLYQVELAKKTIKYDLPLHIGYFVCQYATLRMLEFYHDFLDKYLEWHDYEYIEMDTDSAYIGIAGQSVEELVKPHMREEFYRKWGQWFPAEACKYCQEEFVQQKVKGLVWKPQPCCIKQKKYDKHTPDLFKVEWEGSGMIALCSKTYFSWGEENKCSSKGIDKWHNQLNKEHF